MPRSLQPVVTWGSLELRSDESISVEFNGIELGAPEAARDVLASLLSDGDYAVVTRRGNRTLGLSITMRDVDLAALADLGAALEAEARKPRNVLTIDPGDGFGAVTVFETYEADLATSRDDILEMQAQRRFTATIPTMPFARSVGLVTEGATAIPEAGTLVDACESTTGWASGYGTSTRTVDTSVFSQGTGSLRSTHFFYEVSGYKSYGADVLLYHFASRRTGLSVAVATGGYFSIDVLHDGDMGFYSETFGATLNSRGLARVTLTTSGGDIDLNADAALKFSAPGGFTRYTWPISTSTTISEVLIVGYAYRVLVSSPPAPQLWFDNIRLATTSSTSGQVLKTMTVLGSATATGSIHVASAVDSVPLGQVLAFTVPADTVPTGWRPDLRQFVISGAATTDTAASFGSSYALASSYASSVPVIQTYASRFASGPNTMMLRVARSAGAGDTLVGVEAALMIGSTVVGTPVTTEQTVTFADDKYALVDLGTLYLPPYEVQNPTTAPVVRIRLMGSGLRLDDMYALPVAGDLTIVDCGTGTVGAAASSHLWIDSPSPEQLQGGYWRGATAVRQDTIAAWPGEGGVPGVHRMQPGQMLAFVVALNAQGPTVDFSYFPRWLFHAAL